MDTERIKEIQSKTPYPDSQSVAQALMQVWNEVALEAEQTIADLKQKLRSVGIEYEEEVLEVQHLGTCLICGEGWIAEHGERHKLDCPCRLTAIDEGHSVISR